MVQSLGKAAWKFLTKLNITQPHTPATVLSSMYSNESKTYGHTKP